MQNTNQTSKSDKQIKLNRVLHGKNQDVLKDFPANFFDSVITDPPYELGFMSKAWDASGVAYSISMWKEVLRVAKPGATLFCFGGTRTYHRVACAIEDAGWQLKDSLMWIYGSGFPKSLDISKALDKEAGVKGESLGIQKGIGSNSGDARYNWNNPDDTVDRREYESFAPATDIAKQWNGYGTALKPSFEPIILAMKPLEKGLTYAQNARKWGVAGLNIDAGRIGDEIIPETLRGKSVVTNFMSGGSTPEHKGRWPANVILSHSPDCVQVGTQQINENVKVRQGSVRHKSIWNSTDGDGRVMNAPDNYGQETIDVYACVPNCPIRIMDTQSGKLAVSGRKNPGVCKNDQHGTAFGDNSRGAIPYFDSGGASRFFYTAKASRSERESGLKDFVLCAQCGEFGTEQHKADATTNRPAGNCIRNDHPTTKPVSIMDYLCKLIKMPRQGTQQVILDPFCGSGTTLLAADANGMKYIGIDMIADHVMIATSRSIEPTFEEVAGTQMDASEISSAADQLSSEDFGDLLI